MRPDRGRGQHIQGLEPYVEVPLPFVCREKARHSKGLQICFSVAFLSFLFASLFASRRRENGQKRGRTVAQKKLANSGGGLSQVTASRRRLRARKRQHKRKESDPSGAVRSLGSSSPDVSTAGGARDVSRSGSASDGGSRGAQGPPNITEAAA